MRIPRALFSAVEAYRAKVEGDTGLPVTRSDLLILLIERGLRDATRRKRG